MILNGWLMISVTGVIVSSSRSGQRSGEIREMTKGELEVLKVAGGSE